MTPRFSRKTTFPTKRALETELGSNSTTTRQISQDPLFPNTIRAVLQPGKTREVLRILYKRL